MQSFDAKPISPFPSGSGKTQKAGSGDHVGESRINRDTFSFSFRSSFASCDAGCLNEALGEGSAKGGASPASGLPTELLPVEEGSTRRTFGFLLSSRGCPARPDPSLENPAASGSLPHSPSSNAGERRGKGSGSCLRRLGRAQARAGAAGSARAGERTVAPSPAPALPGPRPFPFLWVPVKPSSPEMSAEHHGICADASR